MTSHFKKTIAFCICLTSLYIQGQDTKLSYHLKKGEAFDILLVANNANSGEAFKEYREKAFPFAVSMGYSFLPGFKITETVQGDHQVTGIILGKWESVHKRKQFSNKIETKVPNFHQLRKKIWSVFDVAYYEVTEDLSFDIDTQKITVLTTYWWGEIEDVGLDNLIAHIKTDMTSNKGILKLGLTDAKSPEGYEYSPDYLVISQWESRTDLDKFTERISAKSKGIEDIHSFILVQ